MYYVWKQQGKRDILIQICDTFTEAMRHARLCGGYVEHDGHVVWGMRF